MCNCACFATTSIVVPAPVKSSVSRGALLMATTGEHVGDMYMLVRETDGVYAKDAAGNDIGGAKYLYNLVNLTNEGKTRVSRPSRKLIWGSQEVPLSVLKAHFGFGMDVLADNISEVSDVMNLVKNTLLMKAAQNQVITLPVGHKTKNYIDMLGALGGLM